MPPGLLDRQHHATEAKNHAKPAALRRQEVNQRTIAAIDARLRRVPAVHPLLAQRQRGGALGVGRVVAFDHSLDRMAQPRVIIPGKMPAQEFGDGEIVPQVSQHGLQLSLMRIVAILTHDVCAVKAPPLAFDLLKG
ncbi:hypothetical protein ACVWW4_005945 [Bradyrhizobium sp. LB7.1]